MLIDRILGAIAPGFQAQRVAARLNLMRIEAAYDAARRTRRTKGWRTESTSANAETETQLVPMRDRSRDLVRNNPYASAGLDMLVAYQVGTGIVPRPRTGDADLDRRVSALWEAWSPHADAARRHDIFGLQALAARTRAESGEALVQLIPLSAAEMRRRGTPVPLALRLLEPDVLPLDVASMQPGVTVRQGVETDASGAAVAYHILTEHPGDPAVVSWSTRRTVRVPAASMLHLYREDRPGQLRGVPDLAPVMTRLRLLDEYEDATLMQAMAQACIAAFITSNAPVSKGPLEGTAETGEPVKTLVPGMVERLLPGEDVQFLAPSGTGPFSEFTRHQLRAVATGFGLTYDLMTGDLSQANYSSLRAGRLAFKRRLEQAQWLMLIPRLCQPVWEAFIQAAQAVGALPPRPEGYPVEWGPPRFEMVDPLKDAMAIRLMTRMGLKTWGQAVAEEGYDPETQALEIAKWNDVADELGLILDGDSRRTGGSGTAQDATQNAAVEIAATGAASG